MFLYDTIRKTKSDKEELMKKLTVIGALIFGVMMYFTGCGMPTAKDTSATYTRDVSEDYACLMLEDKIFVPFCECSKDYEDQVIGTVAYTTTEQGTIYSVKGYSSDEWIIEDSSNTNLDQTTPMLYRENASSSVIDGLTSEYEWNQ